MTPRIETRAVSRRYGRTRALFDVSLSCHAGEALALVGPNGAGKSTLLTLLSTLARPTSGDILYDGRSSAAWGAALRRRFGVLGHDVSLYPELTARENLEFFGRLYALSDLPRRIDAALERAGLRPRADDVVAGFSRGMRQRLAVERALLHEPRLVLFDEPFTGLDDDARQMLLARLRALRETGAIVLIATHDFGTVDEILDRAALLRDGRLVSLTAGGRSLTDPYRASAIGH